MIQICDNLTIFRDFYYRRHCATVENEVIKVSRRKKETVGESADISVTRRVNVEASQLKINWSLL